MLLIILKRKFRVQLFSFKDQRQSYQKFLCGITLNYFHHHSRIFNFQLKFDFNSTEKIF
jgi:hypothetical protein